MKVCSQPGCSRPAHAHGMCHAHAQRARRGSLGAKPVKPAPFTRCSVSGCGRPAHSKQLCDCHALRKRRGLALKVPIRPRRARRLADDAAGERG